MMRHTDRHFRYLMRLLSGDLVLWTEMVKDEKLIHCDSLEIHRRILDGAAPTLPDGTICQGDVVLQLGGGDPACLAQAARLAQPWGYKEVNLNCGCPSPKTSKKRGMEYGANLMKDPAFVRECTAALAEALGPGVEVSVKCRIGVHGTTEDLERDGDSYDRFVAFVDGVAAGGCVRHFAVHARSAVLAGLNTVDNRAVPPLHHGFVHRLAEERPDLRVTLNGGIQTHEEVAEHQRRGLDVMVGRWALTNTWDLAGEEARQRGRGAIIHDYVYNHAAREIQSGVENGVNCHLGRLARPLLRLFVGVRGGAAYRKVLQSLGYQSPEGGFACFEAGVRAALACIPTRHAVAVG